MVAATVQPMTKKLAKEIINAQRAEITEQIVYVRLAHSIREGHNKRLLRRIAAEEGEHYLFWKGYTKEDVHPYRWKIWGYLIIARIFGITFALKLMERGEGKARLSYRMIARHIPSAKKIMKEEEAHEESLLALIDEERMKYVGSMVLGLNDAIIELTGVLAGLTLALRNTRLIAMVGFITGIAASLSMGASEYLSIKTEQGPLVPTKASLYTGSTYILTVLFLISPYLVLADYYVALLVMLSAAVVVICFFTFYISVARDVPFVKRFAEMAGISLGVAALSFTIGYIVRMTCKVDV